MSEPTTEELVNGAFEQGKAIGSVLRPMPPGIAKALVVATREADAVEKRGRMESKRENGPSYRFAGADALMTEAREALGKAKLAIVLVGWFVQTVVREDWAQDGTGPKGEDPPFTERHVRWTERYVTATFMLVHEETGESHVLDAYSMPSIPGPGRPVDKADASALTYATGYVMRGLLNLPRVEPGSQVDERDDSDHAPRTQRKSPSQAEKDEANRQAYLDAMRDDLATSTQPPKEWAAKFGAKSVQRVGMEAVQTAFIPYAIRNGLDEGAALAELAKAVAAAKGQK